MFELVTSIWKSLCPFNSFLSQPLSLPESLFIYTLEKVVLFFERLIPILYGYAHCIKWKLCAFPSLAWNESLLFFWSSSWWLSFSELLLPSVLKVWMDKWEGGGESHPLQPIVSQFLPSVYSWVWPFSRHLLLLEASALPQLADLTTYSIIKPSTWV